MPISRPPVLPVSYFNIIHEFERFGASADETFTPINPFECAFYNNVYNNASFTVGMSYRHDSFIVTPDHCTVSELRAIRARRGRINLGDYDREYSLNIPPGPPRRIRAKLPREPVEALPLPG